MRCVTWLGNNTGQTAHGMAAGTMRIRDTPFEEAIKTFLDSAVDVPWGTDPDTEWLVPAPHGLAWDGSKLTFSDRMWEGEPFTFDQWQPFQYFQVATCDSIDEDGDPKGLKKLEKIKRGEATSTELKPDKLKAYLIVRGVSDGRLEGPWSEPLEVK